MRWNAILWAVSIFIHSTTAIFADDAYHVDFHHALLGIPQASTTFFHKPQSASNASLLYTTSDKALLGAINPKDGTLVWRQPLADEPVQKASNIFLVAGERDGQVISGYGNKVQSWDALDGKLRWEYSVGTGNIVRGLQFVPVSGSSSDKTAQDLAVLIGTATEDGSVTVMKLAGDGSAVRWEHKDSGSAATSVSIASDDKYIYYISKSHGMLASSKAKVWILDSATGKEKNSYNVAVDSDSLGSDGQFAAAACSGAPFLASAEKPYRNIKINVLGNSKTVTLTLEDKSEEIKSLGLHFACSPSAPDHFLVHISTGERNWAEIYHIKKKNGDVVKAYSLPALGEQSTFTASSVGDALYFVRTTANEVSLYSSKSRDQLGQWPRKPVISTPATGYERSPHAAAEVVSSKTGYAVRVAEASANGDFSLIRNGETQWSRPEMLAYATIADWAGDISPDHLVEELQLEASANPLMAYLHRLKRHAHDLAELPIYLMSLPTSIFKTTDGSELTSRQKLVGSNIVILGTSLKELVAVDAMNAGKVQWQVNLAPMLNADTVFKLLVVANGRATLHLSDGSVISVNTTDGTVLQHSTSSTPVSTYVQIPGNTGPVVIKVDSDGKPQIDKGQLSSLPLEGNTVVTIGEGDSAFGWSIGQEPERTWTLRPKPASKFVSIAARPVHDPVASIGKVLGDRTVLYKYVSPNLALLTSKSDSELSLYLINAITGALLHSSSHRGVLPGSSTPAVISENWFAYAFSSKDPTTSAISTQIVVSELYESSLSNDRGALSANANYSAFSADANAKPHVISQAFTIGESVSHLAVTQTAQGITTRQLVAILPESNSILGIPREILNARRPVDRDPTSVEQEEGLFRYNPILDNDPKFLLSHAREVMGIKDVIISPTLLESTGLVFAYGHDIYGTLVAPSMTFDVLGKNFNRIQLSLTVFALFCGVLGIRPVVRKKMAERRWKT